MSSPQSATPPKAVTLEGQYCRLEPLEAKHAEQLFQAVCGDRAAQNHAYLLDGAPASVAEMARWIEGLSPQSDKMFFAVIDKATGICGGRQAHLRIRPEHGSIEIGSVLWGEGIARSRKATEAFFLTAQHIFKDLGNRRFEWKCNNANQASKRAATRFGFTSEGIFRQDLIIRGQNRDTAWFSILDHEWPELRQKFQAWLEPSNFDADGVAKTALATPRL